MSNDFHLAILAIKRQAETLAVRPNQIIRFPIGRMSFLIGGTPSHTETQAMFAEHEYSIRNRLCLVSRCYGRQPVLTVETPGSTVHHITQIGQRSSRESMAGRFPNSQLTTISNTPSRNQLIYHLPAPVRHRRSRKEPVSRKIEPDARSIFRQISCYLKRSIPQLTQLITQIIHLRCTCQLFRIRERERHAVIILVRSRQAKPERSI